MKITRFSRYRRRHSPCAPRERAGGEKEELMRRRLRALLAMGVLVALIALVLSACGSGGSAQEEAKARPLPLHPTEKALSPGEYHSVKFKPPLSFKVGKGWSNTAAQLSDKFELGQQGETGFLTFANVKEVHKPASTYEVVDAPKDLVGWLQQHPYLKTSKPQPVTLGGVKGEQLDVLVKDLPQDYNPLCGPDCVDIAPLSNGQTAAIFREGNERKVFVLEDVKGDTVMIWYAGPPDTFDKFASKARKVVDSVRWEGS
ncbi:MAG: hypothetical protein ACR2FR_08185 [Rubrobacter sp.]